MCGNWRKRSKSKCVLCVRYDIDGGGGNGDGDSRIFGDGLKYTQSILLTMKH